ncbi:MAG: DUF3617 family protein [Gammaproteobacteria bacterium]
MTRARLSSRLVTGLIAGAVTAACAQAASELEPGRWKLHVASTTNGKAEPVQDTEECLQGEELKDLSSYFAPELEGVEARCERNRQPSDDPRKVDYRIRCIGAGFTWEATSSVTVESTVHFTAAMRMETHTQSDSAIVVADISGTRVGHCEPAAPESPPTPAEPAP